MAAAHEADQIPGELARRDELGVEVKDPEVVGEFAAFAEARREHFFPLTNPADRVSVFACRDEQGALALPEGLGEKSQRQQGRARARLGQQNRRGAARRAPGTIPRGNWAIGP